MASTADTTPNITVIPAASLPTQPWWHSVHRLIIAAFLHKPANITVFPPDWKRLPDNPFTAAHSLAWELGDRGHLAVMLQQDQPGQTEQPIACGGVLPYRGDSWINDAQAGKSDADIANAAMSGSPTGEGEGVEEWEVCCFCVSLNHRGRGLSYSLLACLESFVRAHGAKRLYANYAEIETGDFWPRMGFEVVPGAGGMLKKGFKVGAGKEGLRGDVVFKMAVKTLEA